MSSVRSPFHLVALALLVVSATPHRAAGAPASSRAATPHQAAPRWKAKLARWRASRQTHRGNFAAFNHERVFGEIAADKMTLVGHDSERAGRRADPRSKFVIIRSRNAFRHEPGTKGEHVLAIPTPRPPVTGPPSAQQPTHVIEVDGRKAHHLGRMVRAVLTSVDALHPTDARGRPAKNRGWVADIHLPDSITMPVLHVHGQFSDSLRATFHQPRRAPQLRARAGSLSRRGYKEIAGASNGYRLFGASAGKRVDHMDVVAMTPLAMSDYLAGNERLDRLVGKMVLDATAAALARGTTAGYLVIERDNRQVVAKVVARSRKAQPAARLPKRRPGD